MTITELLLAVVAPPGNDGVSFRRGWQCKAIVDIGDPGFAGDEQRIPLNPYGCTHFTYWSPVVEDCLIPLADQKPART